MTDDEERVIDLAVRLLDITRSTAEHWYISDHIPSLGMTAQQAVLAGNVDAVIDYLRGFAEGGFA